MTTSIGSSDVCCPITLGEVCWNNAGNTQRAFAIYDPQTEDTSFVDAVTGNPVAAANIVVCPDDAATTAAAATIARLRAVAAGNVAANKQSATFTNVGTADATVLGVVLVPGETITYTAYLDPVTNIYRRLPVIAYVASATGILSITTMD